MYITYSELLRLVRFGKVSPNGIYYTERGIYRGISITSISLYLSNAVASATGINTGDQLVFKTIAISGQPNVVADTITDTLTLVAGTNITLTTNATTDEITIDASGGGGTGDVVGPGISVNNRVVFFNGVTGKLIKDSGLGLSGSNTGDQTISIGGDVTAAGGTGALTATVIKINGVSLAGLGTGILKNTTGTGVPSIAIAGDFPTLNQSTTGSAATLTTSRNIQGVAFNGSANIDIINGTGFVKATGTALSYDNSTYLTTASASATYQLLDSDLTAIAALAPSNDDILQRKAGAWTNRSISQLQTDLSVSGTNTGDQNLFRRISVSGQPNIDAASTTDVLTFKAGTNITITNDAGLKEVTINAVGGSGDVVGPAGASNNRVVFFDGVTGKLIKDSGLALSGSNTGDQTTIVGISSTMAQFDTAVSDGNIVYQSQALGTPSSGSLTNCTFPTLNQNTTGSAASLSVSGQAGLITLTGITGINRIKTVRDAADTILELGGSYTPTGTWTSLTMVTPVLGTPTSGNLANCTFPTLNQNTTGSAAKLTTSRTIGGVSFDGSADITVLSATGGFTVTGGELVLPAPTTSTASMNMVAGTLETVVEAGDVEYDGTNIYGAIDTTNGRGVIPVVQQFRLTAAGSNIGAAIADYFAAPSSIPLVNGGYYEIEFELYFTKNTAGTVIWTLTNTGAPTSQNIYFNMSPITGIVAPAPGSAGNLEGNFYNDNTAAKAFTVSGSLSSGVVHYAYFRIILRNNTGANLRLRATQSAGTITPGIGSRWKCTRLPATNTGTYSI